jgi:Fur family ferric uptake transcriptional regulator
MGCQETFFSQLRESGFRLTPQREMVLSVMHDMEDFATAEEIYERVHALSSSVDISTVYRTLDLLQEFRVVAVVQPGDGHRRYELLGARGPHLHLICDSCGKVVGADPEPVFPFAEHFRKQYGFEVDLGRLSVPGLCADCVAAGHPTKNTLR